MTKVKRLVVFMVLVLIGCAHLSKEPPCHRIILTNASDKTVIYYIYQPEHNFDVPYPINRAGGELGVGKTNSVCLDANDYFIEWREYRTATLLRIDWFILNRNKEFVLGGESE